MVAAKPKYAPASWTTSDIKRFARDYAPWLAVWSLAEALKERHGGLATPAHGHDAETGSGSDAERDQDGGARRGQFISDGREIDRAQEVATHFLNPFEWSVVIKHPLDDHTRKWAKPEGRDDPL